MADVAKGQMRVRLDEVSPGVFTLTTAYEDENGKALMEFPPLSVKPGDALVLKPVYWQVQFGLFTQVNIDWTIDPDTLEQAKGGT